MPSRTFLIMSLHCVVSWMESNLGSTASHGISASLAAYAADNKDSVACGLPEAIDNNACRNLLMGASGESRLNSAVILSANDFSPHKAKISARQALNAGCAPTLR